MFLHCLSLLRFWVLVALLLVQPLFVFSQSASDIKLQEEEILQALLGTTFLYEDGGHEFFSKNGSAYLNQSGALSYHRWFIADDQLCFLGVGRECWDFWLKPDKTFYLANEKGYAFIANLYVGDPFGSVQAWGRAYKNGLKSQDRFMRGFEKSKAMRIPRKKSRFFTVEPSQSTAPILDISHSQETGIDTLLNQADSTDIPHRKPENNTVAEEIYGSGGYSERLADSELRFIRGVTLDLDTVLRQDPGCYVHQKICLKSCIELSKTNPDLSQGECSKACVDIYLCSEAR